MNQNVLHKSHFLLMLVCLFLIYIDQWTFVCQDKTKRDCLDAPWHFQRGNAFSSAFCIWLVCCKRRLQIFYQSSVGDAMRMIMLRGHFLFPRGSFLSFFFFFKQCWKVYHFLNEMGACAQLNSVRLWELAVCNQTMDLITYREYMSSRKPLLCYERWDTGPWEGTALKGLTQTGVGSCAPPPFMLGCWLALSSWGIIGSWWLTEEGELAIYSGISFLVGYACFSVWLHTQV